MTGRLLMMMMNKVRMVVVVVEWVVVLGLAVEAVLHWRRDVGRLVKRVLDGQESGGCCVVVGCSVVDEGHRRYAGVGGDCRRCCTCLVAGRVAARRRRRRRRRRGEKVIAGLAVQLVHGARRVHVAENQLLVRSGRTDVAVDSVPLSAGLVRMKLKDKACAHNK